jgi:cytochrome c oxidase subunit III
VTARRAIDVSGLPDVAFGHRDPVFWGTAGVIAIEGTMLVLLAATYFYVRGNLEAWPPVGFGARVQALAAIEAAVLVATIVLTNRLTAAAVRGDLRAMQRWLVPATLAGAAFCGLRILQFAWLPFRWDLNAYASTVWAFLGLNFTHAFTGVVEDVLLGIVAFRGPLEKKHLVDFQTGGLLWYFVLASWLPLYVLLYLAPGLLRR